MDVVVNFRDALNDICDNIYPNRCVLKPLLKMNDSKAHSEFRVLLKNGLIDYICRVIEYLEEYKFNDTMFGIYEDIECGYIEYGLFDERYFPAMVPVSPHYIETKDLIFLYMHYIEDIPKYKINRLMSTIYNIMRR